MPSTSRIVPASIRNRNPGAQYPGPSARKFGAHSYETLNSKDGTHKIATFPSDIQGGAAMFDLLASKYTGRSIEAAITRWCGAFYVSTYVKVLEEKGKVSRSDQLTRELLLDADKAIPLARAMAWQEAGRDYPMSEADWRQAHACAFREAVAPAFSPDNDVPSPKPETRQAETVKAVAKVGAAVAVPAAGAGSVVTSTSTVTIPPPPTEIVETASSWRYFTTEAQSFANWLFAPESRITVVLMLAGVAAVIWWSKREESKT